jgi:hypothetical protein
MLALRDLFGYSFRGLFGAALLPPAARAVAMQTFAGAAMPLTKRQREILN